MVFDRSMNFSSSSPKGSAPAGRYFQTYTALSGGADVILPSRSQLLTLIHRYGRNIFRCWRNTHNPAARNLPFHLRQVSEEAGDPSRQVWSIAHQEAELQPGRGGAEGKKNAASNLLAGRAARLSFVFSVPAVFPFNTDPLQLPVCPQEVASCPFTGSGGGKRKPRPQVLYRYKNTLLSLWVLQFRRGGNGSFLSPWLLYRSIATLNALVRNL